MVERCSTMADTRSGSFQLYALRHSPSSPPSTPFSLDLSHLSWNATMLSTSSRWLALILISTLLVNAQQQCYFGPGAANRGPDKLVPCVSDGQSACCLQGDTCLSGNACYNNEIGNVYQYGCTDMTYTDATCPYKCGFSTCACIQRL